MNIINATKNCSSQFGPEWIPSSVFYFVFSLLSLKRNKITRVFQRDKKKKRKTAFYFFFNNQPRQPTSNGFIIQMVLIPLKTLQYIGCYLFPISEIQKNYFVPISKLLPTQKKNKIKIDGPYLKQMSHLLNRVYYAFQFTHSANLGKEKIYSQ